MVCPSLWARLLKTPVSLSRCLPNPLQPSWFQHLCFVFSHQANSRPRVQNQSRYSPLNFLSVLDSEREFSPDREFAPVREIPEPKSESYCTVHYGSNLYVSLGHTQLHISPVMAPTHEPAQESAPVHNPIAPPKKTLWAGTIVVEPSFRVKPTRPILPGPLLYSPATAPEYPPSHPSWILLCV